MMKTFLPRNEYTRNILTLMGGNIISQSLPIAISPILTRIYTPADFGLFSILISISMIFGSISNGRYELAIMLPQNEEDAINITALGFFITLFITITLLIIIYLFNETIVHILGNPNLGSWLYFVPFSVFFIGVFNVLNFFNNRKKQYKELAKVSIIKSVVLVSSQLIIGLFKNGIFGLVIGNLLSNLLSNLILFLKFIRKRENIKKITIDKMFLLAARYQDFPKFSLPAILSNTLSINLLNILISTFFSVVTLGYYSLVQRILAIPSIFIGNSIGQVYFKHATIEKNKNGNCVETFNSTIKKLLLLGIPTFTILFFSVETIFTIVFGEDWRLAGTYAKIATPLFFIRFIVASVSNTNNIFELQKVALIWQLFLLILSLLCLSISVYLEIIFIDFLKLFCFIISCHYLILFLILRRVSFKGKLL